MCFCLMRGRLGVLAFFPAAVLRMGSPAATVGHSATPRCFISLNISALPSSPCSMVSTPASVARRMPSTVEACATTPRPAERAVCTISVELFLRESGLGGVIMSPAVISVHLNKVGPLADLLPHGTHDAVHAVGLLGTLGHVNVGGTAWGRSCPWPPAPAWPPAGAGPGIMPWLIACFRPTSA